MNSVKWIAAGGKLHPNVNSTVHQTTNADLYVL